MTSVIDNGTRVLLGWVITLTPSTATVLTALRMALTHDVQHGPFGAVPARTRIERGLEFAAQAVTDEELVTTGRARSWHRRDRARPHAGRRP